MPEPTRAETFPVWSRKRLAAALVLTPVLIALAYVYACGTGLTDGTRHWNGRDFLGAALFPPAFIPERFELLGAGWFEPRELLLVLPFEFAYAYGLLTVLAAIGRRPRPKTP